MKSWCKEDAHRTLGMESSSEIIPARPLCCIDEGTEAGESDLFRAPLRFPGSESGAHCKTPGCPGDTICPAFKNDIDVKTVVSRVKNSCRARWDRKSCLLQVLSLSADILSPSGGREQRGCQSGKLLSSCDARTKGTLHQAPNLSKGRTCQLLAFAFSLSQSFCNSHAPLEIRLNPVWTPVPQAITFWSVPSLV